LQLSFDHRDDLLDTLKKIELDVDIPVAKFIELIANLDKNLVCNMIFFQDSELPSEDVIENNLTYISMLMMMVFLLKHY